MPEPRSSRADELLASAEPERTPAPLPPDPLSDPPAVLPSTQPSTLKAVLGHGSDVLRSALQGAAPDAVEFDHLASLFESAQLPVAGATRTPEAEAEYGAREEQRCTSGHAPKGGPELSEAELSARVAWLDQAARAPLDFQAADTALEQVSILLQMLSIASNDDIAGAVARRLDGLPNGDRAEAVETARSALIDLAEKLPFEQFDRVFPSVASLLQLDAGQRMTETLPLLAQKCSERAREALWPHAADEVLRYPAKDGQAGLVRLLRFVDELPLYAMARAVARLCRLPALAQRKLADDFFDPGQVLSYRLFAYVLLSPRAELIGPAVMAGLAWHPLAIDGATNVLRALERYRPEHTSFLHHLLLSLVAGRASREYELQACTLLSRALRRLETARRKEVWVPEAIAYLGTVRYAAARSLLESIHGQRRWVVTRRWSSACRAQAARALARLDEEEVDD